MLNKQNQLLYEQVHIKICTSPDGENSQFGAICRYFSQRDRYRTRSQKGQKNPWDETQVGSGCTGEKTEMCMFKEKIMRSGLGEHSDHKPQIRVSVMFWGCIAYDDIGTLAPVDGNINSPKSMWIFLKITFGLLLLKYSHTLPGYFGYFKMTMQPQYMYL